MFTREYAEKLTHRMIKGALICLDSPDPYLPFEHVTDAQREKIEEKLGLAIADILSDVVGVQ